MIRALRQLALLTGKDLRIEARSLQTLGLVVVLGILIITVLALGLAAPQHTSALSASAILWVAYFFGGTMCFEKTMAVERSNGAMAGLLLAPVDRGVLFLAKLLSNLILMLALVAVVTPVAIVLFDFDLSAAPLAFAVITFLGLLGFAAVGTLFSAAVSSSRFHGGLLSIIIFPLCLPLVVTSTQMMIALCRDGHPMGADGLGILVAFDAIYLVVSWLAFEKILQP